MKSILTLCLTGIAALLTACGGGSSAYVSTTPDTCTLQLSYIDVIHSSGVLVPESNPPNWSLSGVDVTRNLSCAIQRIQQVKVGLCLEVPDNPKLEARLVAPDQSYIALDLTSATSTTGCTGLVTTGNLLTVTLAGTALSNPAQANGNWLVQVRDNTPDATDSTLVGWSLQLDGVK